MGEVCGSTSESGDGSGIDGDGGFAIEGVERSSINGGVADGDGVGVAGFGEAGKCCEIAIRDGGGDDAGCCSSESVGLRGGSSAAADGNGFIAKVADAGGGVRSDQVCGSTR